MNDDNSTPLTVSVVMCTYNGKQFLREQMDSILAQDYPLHEIIVQDDRSTDDTWDILQPMPRHTRACSSCSATTSNWGSTATFTLPCCVPQGNTWPSATRTTFGFHRK